MVDGALKSFHPPCPVGARVDGHFEHKFERMHKVNEYAEWARQRRYDRMSEKDHAAPARDESSIDEENLYLSEEEEYKEKDPNHTETRQPDASNSLGFQMLCNFGWTPGTGIGKNPGRVDPLPIQEYYESVGVGKLAQDLQVMKQSTLRPLMRTEKLERESSRDREKRQAQVLRDTELKSELHQVRQSFYCELCDKQYKKSSEYETHLSSYDHHHKKRKKGLRSAERKVLGVQVDLDKEAKKSKKREEREIRKMIEAVPKTLPKFASPCPNESQPTTFTQNQSSNAFKITQSRPALVFSFKK